MKTSPCPTCNSTVSPAVKFDTLRFDNTTDKIVANASCRTEECKFNVNLMFEARMMPLTDLAPTMNKEWNAKVETTLES